MYSVGYIAISLAYACKFDRLILLYSTGLTCQSRIDLFYRYILQTLLQKGQHLFTKLRGLIFPLHHMLISNILGGQREGTVMLTVYIVVKHETPNIRRCFQPHPATVCTRGGFRGVSEVSRNHSGFSLDDGYVPFRLQHFMRHTQRAE